MVIDTAALFAVPGTVIPFDYAFRPPGGQALRRGVAVVGDAQARGVLQNRHGAVTLEGEVSCRYEAPCDRCLKVIQRALRAPLALALQREGGASTDEDAVQVGALLDLDAQLLEELILVLPHKLLCDESCRGLCPVCGEPLEAGCACGAGPGNSAFSSLADLLRD